MGVSAQGERAKLPFFCLFVLLSSSVDWMMPTCTGEGDLLYSLYPLQSFPRSLLDTPSNVLPALWASFSSVKLTHNIVTATKPSKKVGNGDREVNKEVIPVSNYILITLHGARVEYIL